MIVLVFYIYIWIFVILGDIFLFQLLSFEMWRENKLIPVYPLLRVCLLKRFGFIVPYSFIFIFGILVIFFLSVLTHGPQRWNRGSTDGLFLLLLLLLLLLHTTNLGHCKDNQSRQYGFTDNAILFVKTSGREQPRTLRALLDVPNDVFNVFAERGGRTALVTAGINTWKVPQFCSKDVIVCQTKINNKLTFLVREAS